MITFKRFILLLSLILIFIPQVAHAYLDPGSISYVFQIIAGGIVGILIGLRFFGGTIKAFIKKMFSKKKTEETEETEE